MFKIAKIGTSTLQKIIPAGKTVGKTVGSGLVRTTLGAVKLPFSALLKLNSTLMPMIGSALLTGIYLLVKLLK